MIVYTLVFTTTRVWSTSLIPWATIAHVRRSRARVVRGVQPACYVTFTSHRTTGWEAWRLLCCWCAGEGKKRLSNNAIFLLECVFIALISQVLSMADLYNTMVMYVVMWAAWKLYVEAPEGIKHVAKLVSGIIVCNACYYLLQNPVWFKSVIAL